MPYQALNEQTIIPYLRSHPTLEPIIDPTTPLTAKEVGDGNLNTVYIRSSNSGLKTVSMI